MDSSTGALVVPSGPPPQEEEEEEKKDQGGQASKRTKKELTEDLIVDILVRLPAKSLMRFKSISQHWYSLIKSPNFIALHSAHSHRNNKIFSLWTSLQRNIVVTPSDIHVIRIFEFGDGSVQELPFYSSELIRVGIVGCFNGVVCLSISPTQRTYVLWNPATRQVREIGGSLMDDESNGRIWYGSGFWFDPVTNSFKVVQIKLTDSEGGGRARARVSLFWTSNSSWTVKNMDFPYKIVWSTGCTVRVDTTTCVNGYMHWHEGRYILSYNMNDEVFQRIEMPSCPVSLKYRLLTHYRGSLSVLVNRHSDSDRLHTEIDVWVLNDCGGKNQSWSKIMTCKPSIEFCCAKGFFSKDGVDLIILDRGLVRDCLYDPENEEIKIYEGSQIIPTTYPYSESLVSLE